MLQRAAPVTPMRLSGPAAIARAAMRGFTRRFAGYLVAAVAATALAACASGPRPGASAGSGGGASQTTTGGASGPSVDPNAPIVVALLAPTTAADEGVRRAAQDLVAAAQMARAERAPPNMVMKIYDTRGSDAGAAEAAGHAVRDGSVLILGPLLASSTRAVAPVAANAGLNVISFSNDTSAAGGNVWVLGRTPDDEMRRIFSFAAAEGARSVAVAYPENRYGQSVASAANGAARAAGVSIATIVGYPYSPQRGRGNFDAISEAGAGMTASIRSSGADAVLLADVGNDLAALGSFLNYNGLSPRQTRFLGLSRWSTSATLREESLKGGVFAAEDPTMLAGFERAFTARLSRRPSTVAGIGYDAVIAAADMLIAARGGGAGAVFGAGAITSGVHAGATGDFALTADGANRRALSILQVGEQGFRVIDPAPRLAPGA